MILIFILVILGVIVWILWKREKFTTLDDTTDPNIRLLPAYFYTYPYMNQGLRAWPANMYSKFFYDYPGFLTSGWGYSVRPGMDTDLRWPRNTWIANPPGRGYDYINNNNHPVSFS